MAILGLDFLTHFAMSIDLHRGLLIHSGVSTQFSTATSSISGVNVVRSESSFLRILRESPEITDVNLASCTTKHGVECYNINTSGPPIRTPPRRLSPEKLRVAKQYFDVMCAAGICRRSIRVFISQLAVISEFVTDIAHVPGLENVVADALTRQYDDGEPTAFVHAVAHVLTDVKLDELAAGQPSIDDESRTSLVLERVVFPGVERSLVCGRIAQMATSTGTGSVAKTNFRGRSQAVPSIGESNGWNHF